MAPPFDEVDIVLLFVKVQPEVTPMFSVAAAWTLMAPPLLPVAVLPSKIVPSRLTVDVVPMICNAPPAVAAVLFENVHPEILRMVEPDRVATAPPAPVAALLPLNTQSVSRRLVLAA